MKIVILIILFILIFYEMLTGDLLQEPLNKWRKKRR